MFGWADTNWLRVCGYVLVAMLCLAAVRREDRDDPSTWPPFWLLTGGLFLVMAIGRAGDIGDLVSDALRQRATDDGWYESRRRLQALVVGALGFTWFAVVTVACWRVPERRRRYLPMIVITVTIAVYAAMRVVSLHQLDAILYRRRYADMRFGTIVEYALLLAAGACAFWTPGRRLNDWIERPTAATSISPR